MRDGLLVGKPLMMTNERKPCFDVGVGGGGGWNKKQENFR